LRLDDDHSKSLPAPLTQAGSVGSIRVGTHSVKRHLDVDAEGYDVQIHRFIPHYDDMLATGVALLARLVAPEAHVLDVGAGTGALSEAVLEGLPQARVTLLDVDVEMLAEARRRLQGFGDRVASARAASDPLPTADAIVASLALHHVHDLELKTRVTGAVHARWRPGACCSTSTLRQQGPACQRARLRAFGRAMAEHEIAEDAGARPLRRLGDEDRYFPLDAELAALRNAGFARSSASGAAASAICCGVRAR